MLDHHVIVHCPFWTTNLIASTAPHRSLQMEHHLRIALLARSHIAVRILANEFAEVKGLPWDLSRHQHNRRAELRGHDLPWLPLHPWCANSASDLNSLKKSHFAGGAGSLRKYGGCS